MHTDHFFTPPVTDDQIGVRVCLIFRYFIGHGIGLWIRETSLLIHSPILFALPQRALLRDFYSQQASPGLIGAGKSISFCSVKDSRW